MLKSLTDKGLIILILQVNGSSQSILLNFISVLFWFLLNAIIVFNNNQPLEYALLMRTGKEHG